jgi:hypothetical protein
MQPIVNGLEAEFAGQLAFERQRADMATGQALMRTYNIRGHPSYVLVAPDGEMLWSATGALPAETLRQQIARGVD